MNILPRPTRRGAGLDVMAPRLISVRPVLRLGDPCLRRVAKPVQAFDTAALAELIEELRDTMAALDGPGLAALQIGVPLRVVIFCVTTKPRYPEAPPIPETVLINPCLHPLDPLGP